MVDYVDSVEMTFGYYNRLLIEDTHNSWLYCFTNPLELGTRVSLSHCQLCDAKAKHLSQVQKDL